jgi:hypothetical protein
LKKSAILLIAFLVLLIINSIITFATSNNPCQGYLFCLGDAFNDTITGNLSVIGCAGTSTNVSSFNFWYNNTASLLNNTTSGVMSMNYYNYLTGTAGSVYNNESISNSTDPPCVKFVLNRSYTNTSIPINATVYYLTNYTTALGTCTGGPAACNASMFTINYVYISTRNSGGSSLSNIPLMMFNNTTKAHLSTMPAMTDSSGYWMEHCVGTFNQTTGLCYNATLFISPNSCFYHGTAFNDSGSSCSINSTTTLHAIDILSANTTQQDVTPGTPLTMTLSTSTSMSMIMVFSWNPTSSQSMSSISASSNVYEWNTSVTDSNQLLFSLSSEGPGGGGGPPAFIQPFKIYKINFSYSGTNYNFPFMSPSSGPTSAQIYLANSTSFGSSDYRTFVGKVVNETGSAISNALVYAQFYKGPGGAFGISFFNSSVTDSNGVFSMKVPRSMAPGESGNPGGSMYFPLYQFYIVSNTTNSTNGVPIYFPTIDNNNDKGYFAIADTVVLPPLTLKRGGQVIVNVTLNNATQVMSELNKLLSLGTGVSRDTGTGKFTMTQIFGNVNPPSVINISLLSPIGNPVVNLFGKNNSFFGGDPMTGSIISSCFNNTTVSQGVSTNINCNLTTPGYLNLTVWACQDLFTSNISYPSSDPACNMNMRAGRFDSWFEMNGVLRNATTGQAISYLSPEGVLLENLVGFGTNDPAIRIPLPPGSYILELMSPFEHSWYMNVYNQTAFTITAGSTTLLTLTKSRSWNIQPLFNPSLTLSSNNSINVSVMSESGSWLNNTHINLTAKVLLLNKSTAISSIITFGNDSSKRIFYNTTFNPSSLGLGAGKYLIMLNATNVTGSTSYTTTFLMPINIFDFQVGLDLGGFTFGTSQTISAKIFAYNTSTSPPVGLNASQGNVTVTVYDTSGANVTSATATASAITNGTGSVNITMPSTLGFYEIVTSVRTDNCFAAGCNNNTYGVADSWVQISNLNIRTTTERQSYQTSDNVILTVQVSNATNGTAISGASVEAVVDNSNTPAFGTTGSDGKATITLNASTHSDSGSSSWSYGWHNLRIKISKDLGTDVVKLDTWYGFDVRGFDLFLRPDRPTYGVTDNVTIAVYGPLESFSITGVKVDGTTLTQGPLGNCNVTPNVTFCIEDTAWGSGSNNVKIANWSVGHHNVEVTVSMGGSQQKFYTGFDVSNYNTIATTDRFTYNLNQNITLNIKANYLNGTALNNTNIIATLFKAQSPNDIYVTQTNNTTNSTGQATFTLGATKPGFNYIKINVSGQLQFIGVQVSSVNVTLLNSTSGSVVTNYNAAPGSTVTIYINATSGSANVPDSSTVTATLWAFGNRVELPSNTTTNGNATISYQIPSFASTQVYGLEVRVTTPTGDQGFAPPATLTVTGGSSLQLSVLADRSFSNPYKSGDNATLTATLTYSNGTAAVGHNITFEVGSEGKVPQTIGTAVTGSGGTATRTFSITTNYSDGPYFLHAFITNNTDVKAYSGFLVSSLKLNIISDRTNNTYSPGENITLNVTLYNTTGSQINATNGFAFIFSKEKGMIKQYINTANLAQPYQVGIPIPNEASAIGTYPIAVVMFVNQSQGIGFIMVDVKNTSYSLNLTLPSAITAGTSFLANISSSLNNTATLRVFSPAASSLVYENTSINLIASGTVNITISNPGVYVFNAFVSGVGSTTNIVTISQTTGTMPAVWTGTSTSVNATTFTTSQSVYVMSNTANNTATILTVDTTTNTTISVSLPLTISSGSNYYGIFNNTNLVSGRKYFVRLDTSSATGLANTMFTVS